MKLIIICIFILHLTLSCSICGQIFITTLNQPLDFGDQLSQLLRIQEVHGMLDFSDLKLRTVLDKSGHLTDYLLTYWHLTYLPYLSSSFYFKLMILASTLKNYFKKVEKKIVKVKRKRNSTINKRGNQWIRKWEITEKIKSMFISLKIFIKLTHP